MISEKNHMGLLMNKIEQILKHFAGTFHALMDLKKIDRANIWLILEFSKYIGTHETLTHNLLILWSGIYQ